MSRALVGQTASHLAELDGAQVEWKAFGHIGITTEKFLQRYQNGLPEADPDWIIISLGVNDITGLATTRRWVEGLSELMHRCRKKYPRASIALAGIPPLGVFPVLPEPMRTLIGRRGESFDKLGRSMADTLDRVVHVPIEFNPGSGRFSADGFHPSEESYIEFGRSMAEALLSAR